MEKILKWFTENYIQNEEECFILLTKAQINYPFTIMQLYNGCSELKKTTPNDKSDLIFHIKILGDFCYFGINAYEAGVLIRKTLLKMKELKQG